jgi:lactoylglutathione lyase
MNGNDGEWKEDVMEFTFVHNNINVLDMDRSVAFYREALGMEIVRTKEPKDGSFRLVYLEAPGSPHQLELTWLKEWDRPYNLGDNESHMAFVTDQYDEAYAFHKEKGWIVYENPAMGIYFIADPDNYWIEIIPKK